jgi:hypothetical protein
MAKQHTFPTLYNDVRTLSTAFLRDNGYLKPSQWQTGIVTWRRNGEKVASISIAVDTSSPNPYVELDYSYQGNPIRYKVRLIQQPSNLGRGFQWYFVCPNTGKRCRKLYLISGYFYHREAFKGCMYEKQTQSKYARLLDKNFGLLFRTDELYDQLCKKYFKKRYAGKPTKRYLQITKKINKSENADVSQLKYLLYRHTDR